MSNETIDIFSLSDEEIAKLDPSQLSALSEEDTGEGTTEEATDATSTDGASATEGAEGAEGADEGDDTGEVTQPQGNAFAEGQPAGEKPTEQAGEKPADTTPPAGDDGIDYKAAYERITAPFKANGKEMRITDVEDVVALMQMGANYNKKMAALKPNLKILKLLENNGLLSEEKLGFLIDLSKKDKGAIEKLVKDAGIDPLDMDVSRESEYKPKTHAVDDREIELDTVLEEIQDTPTYSQLITLVSQKWDGPSKQTVANNPQLLKVISGHMASGVYDVISAEVERERMLGRLTGVSDIEAYRQVGDAIHARNGFAHLFAPKTPVATEKPKPQSNDAGLKDRKRAASSTSATPAAAKSADFNPLALSDEQFSKLMNEKFL